MNIEVLLATLLLFVVHFAGVQRHIKRSTSTSIRQFNKRIRTLTATIQLFDGVFETTLGNLTASKIPRYANIYTSFSEDQIAQLQENLLLLYSTMDCTIAAGLFTESFSKVLNNGAPQDILKVFKKGKFIANRCLKRVMLI
mmetsp:Transcript_23013/g.33967  ORF Transcript_23013/g.33967 Transcript_23013/m.33967 type:complete len:141 (+) Transcript_23013:15-437(+)